MPHASVIVSDGFAVLMDYFITAIDREKQTTLKIMLRQNPRSSKTAWELQTTKQGC
jgi:hypothetical protein